MRRKCKKGPADCCQCRCCCASDPLSSFAIFAFSGRISGLGSDGYGASAILTIVALNSGVQMKRIRRPCFGFRNLQTRLAHYKCGLRCCGKDWIAVGNEDPPLDSSSNISAISCYARAEPSATGCHLLSLAPPARTRMTAAHGVHRA